MKCKSCGAELMEGIIFCPECGERNDVEEAQKQKEESNVPQKYCPQCGAVNIQDAGFCVNCGFSFTEDMTPQKKEKKNVHWKKSYTAVVAVVIIIGMAIFAGQYLFAGKSSSQKLLYLKDNEINIMTGKKPNVIQDDFAENAVGYTQSYYPIRFSEDGKYIYYPSDYSSGSYDLYRKKVKSRKDDGEKIESGIKSYAIINNHRMIYLKSGEGKLYISDMKDKEKIASDVSWFRLSNDNKNILWYTNDSKLYVQDINLKKDKIKIDTDVNITYYISDDLKTILYKKDANLYVSKNFDDREKVASDVVNVNVYHTEDFVSVYYTINESVDLSFTDLINDDMEASDALIKEPDITDYQVTTKKNSFWGQIDSTETDWDNYNADVEKYNEKAVRDNIREYMNETMKIDSIALYYHNIQSNKTEKVFYAPIESDSPRYAGNICVIEYYDLDAIEKINISTFTEDNFWQMEEDVRKALRSTKRICAIKEKNRVELDIDASEYNGIRQIFADGANDMLYLAYDNNGAGETLFCTDVKKDNGEVKEITDEAYAVEEVTVDGVYYIKEVDKNGEGELYLNDKFISDEVSAGTVTVYGKKDIMYYTDTNNSEGTLMIYNGNTMKKVSEDVADYLKLEDNSIAVLVDYNFSKNRGDLKLYHNGKMKSLDTDVTAILRY